MVSKRHKVFISYHHDVDQAYADEIRDLYDGEAIIDKSMYDDFSHLQTDTILNKIRQEHLLDSTVTVVLIGEHTSIAPTKGCSQLITTGHDSMLVL